MAPATNADPQPDRAGNEPGPAVLTGLSRKGYWHLSKTLVTKTGITNELLAKQGLISIRDLWLKARGYA
jgi:RNA-directed DNA polymerase